MDKNVLKQLQCVIVHYLEPYPGKKKKKSKIIKKAKLSTWGKHQLRFMVLEVLLVCFIKYHFAFLRHPAEPLSYLYSWGNICLKGD